ncbi:hypothetical protein [Nesterenkonia lutea]|uniref:WxL domain-containing protein n=1 Tax=Nesterenkonia lutea TaxID=272919 RepID=A0ABR9JD11_9MICC|nr:hypothetical protein [Nesterenkonia lutea]MBE1523377.1 hypothetical protein [Nesterenkonia lutea]
MRTSVKTVTVGSLLAASMFITPAALAAESTATATVTGGSLSASAEDVALAAVTTSHAAQTTSGTVNLAVDDSTGTGDGWSVTQVVSDFGYTDGGNAGDAIAAEHFVVSSVGTVSALAGADGAETVDVGTAGSLGTERTVLSAAAENGEGSYTVPLSVDLNIPEGSRAGAYAAVLTTTTAATPAL